MNKFYKMIEKDVTLPLRRVAIDPEFRRDTNGNLCLRQIALHDVNKNVPIDNFLVKPESPYSIHKKDQQIGFTEKELSNAKTIEEIDAALSSHLRGSILGFWGRDNDLKNYPALIEHGHATACVMRIYSSEFGPWNPEFSNRSLVSLQDAAINRGFKLPRGCHFHDARVDAAATAFIWRFLDNHFLPKAPGKSFKEIDKYSAFDRA